MPTERLLNELSFHSINTLICSTFHFIDIDVHFSFSYLHFSFIAKIVYFSPYIEEADLN